MELVRGALHVKILLWLLLATTSLYICNGKDWSWGWETGEEPVDEDIFKCKEEYARCYGFPPCCGSWSCYWKGGYTLLRSGKCVMCIDHKRVCQSDRSCCPGLICDSNERSDFSGKCRKPRTAGACYRETQCRFSCKRGKYKSKGRCINNPPLDSAGVYEIEESHIQMPD